MDLIGLLLLVLILLIVVYAVKVLIDWIELPGPVRTVALLLVGAVALLLVLSKLGVKAW